MNVVNLGFLPSISNSTDNSRNNSKNTYYILTKKNNNNIESTDSIYTYRPHIKKNLCLNVKLNSQKNKDSVNNINPIMHNLNQQYNIKKTNLSQTRYGSKYYKKQVFKIKDNINRNKTPAKSISLKSNNLNPLLKKDNINKSSMNYTLYHKLKECPLCHKKIERYKYTFHCNNHPSAILPWLYLGSYKNACNSEDLNNLNIKYILNCAFECLNHFPKTIKYKHLKLFDHPCFNIIDFFDTAVNFIEEAKNNDSNILVHCQMGISRSASCVLAYLVSKCNYTVMSGLQFIKKKRPIVMPNYGFLHQLMIYQNNHN